MSSMKVCAIGNTRLIRLDIENSLYIKHLRAHDGCTYRDKLISFAQMALNQRAIAKMHDKAAQDTDNATLRSWHMALRNAADYRSIIWRARHVQM